MNGQTVALCMIAAFAKLIFSRDLITERRMSAPVPVPNNRHLLRPRSRAEEISIMKTIQSNLIHLAQNGDFDLIVHDNNCFCMMGAGIAKGINAAFR